MYCISTYAAHGQAMIMAILVISLNEPKLCLIKMFRCWTNDRFTMSLDNHRAKFKQHPHQHNNSICRLFDITKYICIHILAEIQHFSNNLLVAQSTTNVEIVLKISGILNLITILLLFHLICETISMESTRNLEIN